VQSCTGVCMAVYVPVLVLLPRAVLRRSMPLHDGCAHCLVSCAEQAIENGGDEGIDVLSRYFGPWCGVDEDPVTGSAHCVLAPHFCRKLQRGNLRAQQGSRRTGTLRMACEEGSDFVVLRGSGVVVKRGDSMLPPRKGAPKQPEPLPPVTPELSTE
jgi:predicted PhzF superfamily epimerase YddE/YHI9